ncbi:MAG: hypothetical protein LBJ69_01265 [Holosporales bacterium]|jgi:diaminopimelate epimerase|nr:hypothetical protein [Holosporales bacterium]
MSDNSSISKRSKSGHIEFTKAHVNGNDFVIIHTPPPSNPSESGLLLGDTERRSGVYKEVHEHSSTGSTKEETDYEWLSADSVRAISDRRTGIGCDQLLLVWKDEKSSLTTVTIFNNDGTKASMCGNGICAVAYCIGYMNLPPSNPPESELLLGDTERRSGVYKEVHEHSSTGSTQKETDYGGFRKGAISLMVEGGCECAVEVHGQEVTAQIPMPVADGRGIITVGNKHLVRLMSEIGDADRIAKKHPECNIHFVAVIDDNTIRVKTLERGAGWTRACGSGAVASVFGSLISPSTNPPQSVSSFVDPVLECSCTPLYTPLLRSVSPSNNSDSEGFERGGVLGGRIKVLHDGGTSFVEIMEDHVKLTVRPQIVFKGVWNEQSSD